MRRVHGVLAHLFGALLVVQFFLAGYGAFKTVNDKKFDDNNFGPHALLGTFLIVLSLVLFILALIGRWSSSARNFSGILFGLMIIQSGLGTLGADNSVWFGAVHAVNALAILAVTGVLIRGSRASAPSPPAEPVATAPGTGV
jgi:hypothetical protein